MSYSNVTPGNFNPKMDTKKILTIFIGFLVLITLAKSIVVVKAGQRAVVFNSFSGIEERTLTEGMHLLLPYIQQPISYSVRTQTYTMASGRSEGRNVSDQALECLTSDGQKITVDLSLRYSLEADKVWQLHKEVGTYYESKIIRPEIRSVTRTTFANYPVVEVYSNKRELIQDAIQEKVKLTLNKYYIDAQEVLIRNITFSDEFAKSIEQKQVALQDAEKMKYVNQKAELEAKRKEIEARGRANAINLEGKALRANPRYIQLRYVEKVAPGIKAIITDQASIMNFPEDLLKN